MNAVISPPHTSQCTFTCVIVNFLFNAHPRAVTAANGKRAVLSLEIIDACGKRRTAIAKEFDVAKSTMTLLKVYGSY